MIARAGRWARHLFGLGLVVLFALPFYWTVVASLRQPGLPPPASVEWWPAAPHWDNYAEIFRLVPLGHYLRNSLAVLAVALPVTLLTASLAGFGLAQLPAAWQRRGFAASVALLMVPGLAVWMFRYRVLDVLGLLDSLWALIVPAFAASSPLFVLLYYWTYRRVPADMFESARLDGAAAWTAWWRIGQPLAWPTTAAVAVLTVLQYWSDFTSPVIYIYRPDLYTLPVGLQILNQMDAASWPLLMAAAVVMALPVLLLFIALQRLVLRDLSLAGLLDKVE